MILTGIGILGAFLPLLPTTIFLIMAAWCFGRSSPRFEAWLLNHPHFGPSLRAWRVSGAVPRRAKYLAFTGMAAGYAIFYVSAMPRWPTALAVGVAMLGSALYVGTRPDGA
ncbi:YbaN family protein [Tianweitania aestuarii]|nr:YbaN family protein [Tianweitania aestuarii]